MQTKEYSSTTKVGSCAKAIGNVEEKTETARQGHARHLASLKPTRLTHFVIEINEVNNQVQIGNSGERCGVNTNV